MKKKQIVHRPEKFGFRSKDDEEFPRVILVATASPCNARCPHCPCATMPILRKTEDPFVRLEYFKKMIDEASHYDTNLRLSGYGEPLLHPNFFEVVEYASKKKVNFSLITNGSLFTDEKIKRIIELDVDSIEISVDSHKEEIYKKIRVGLDFKKVKNNIINLVKTRDRLKKHTVIMGSIINQPSRNPEIKQAEAYWAKIVDKVMIRAYVTWGILPTNDYGEPYLDPVNREPCPYPFERLLIDPAGYIRLCPNDNQKIIPPLGHLKTHTIKEVWHSKRMNKIREGHLKRKFNKVELCNICTDYAYRSWNYNYASALKEARKKVSQSSNQ